MLRKSVVSISMVMGITIYSGFAYADTFNFNSIADGYVQIGPNGTAGIGNTQALEVGRTTNGGPYTFKSVLEFDLSSIPDNYQILSAVLTLYPWSSSYNGKPLIDMYWSSANGWSDTSSADIINAVDGMAGPALVTDMSGFDHTYPDTQPSYWDLMANGNWDYTIDLNDNFLTLGFESTSGGNKYQPFWSKEAGPTYPGFVPTLAIETAGPAPVPEPATMLLLGTGIIGLSGLARRKKV